MIQQECQTRRQTTLRIVTFEERYRFFQKWAAVLRTPDPFYSESLAPTETLQLNFGGPYPLRRILAQETEFLEA